MIIKFNEYKLNENPNAIAVPFGIKNIEWDEQIGFENTENNISWEQAKRTSENKLYESPDRIYYNKKILNFNTYDAVPFGFIKKYIFNKIKWLKKPDGKSKENFVLGKEYTTHPYICNDYGLYDIQDFSIMMHEALLYFDYAGRLWSKDKIMSFWQYPKTKEKLKEIINYINELSDDYKIDDTWKIEIYTGDEIKNKWKNDINQDIEGNFTSNNSIIIPINQYNGSEDPPEEEIILHNLNWKERERLKKQGKINLKGWGSDLKAKRNPLEWEQAKRTSESMKYLKYFESADEIYIPEFDEIVEFDYDDAFPFAWDNRINKLIVGDSATMHIENGIRYTFDFDFHGRIWLENGVIGFWDYPDKDKFIKIINQLEEKLGEKIWDNNFKVEIIDDIGYELIPIEEYETSQDTPEEKKFVHLMNFKEKEQYYKKYGKPKGFGSDLKSKKNPIWWEQAKRTSESVYPNKMMKIAEDELSKTTGGHEYFDKIDAALKLPKNLDIIKSIFLQIQKEQGTHFNLILTGGFGDWVMSLIKKGVLKVPGNLVTTNGSIRGKGNKLGKYTKGKEVDVIHKKNDIDNQKFIMFDDSYYSGSTKKALEDYLKKYNSEIYKTYVLYDGNDKVDDNRKSLYRYYDYHTGSKLGVDILIDYLYSLKLDIPKDIIRDKILKGTITTIKEIRDQINIFLQKFGKQPLDKLTHKETSHILKSFESFETESELIFVEGETLDL